MAEESEASPLLKGAMASFGIGTRIWCRKDMATGQLFLPVTIRAASSTTPVEPPAANVVECNSPQPTALAFAAREESVQHAPPNGTRANAFSFCADTNDVPLFSRPCLVTFAGLGQQAGCVGASQIGRADRDVDCGSCKGSGEEMVVDDEEREVVMMDEEEVVEMGAEMGVEMGMQEEEEVEVEVEVDEEYEEYEGVPYDGDPSGSRNLLVGLQDPASRAGAPKRKRAMRSPREMTSPPGHLDVGAATACVGSGMAHSPLTVVAAHGQARSAVPLGKRSKLGEDEEGEVEAASLTNSALVTEAGGYELILSSKSSTGYKGVSYMRQLGCGKPFQMKYKDHQFKYFTTAVDAAIAYARAAGAPRAGAGKAAPDQGETAAADDMKEDNDDGNEGEVVVVEEEQAAPTVTEARGYELILSSKSNTGYRGVCYSPKVSRNRPFQMRYAGQHDFFATAVDAAVAYARLTQEATGNVVSSCPSLPPPPSAPLPPPQLSTPPPPAAPLLPALPPSLPPSPQAQLDGMDAVRALLVDMRLEQYAEAFDELGYDDMHFLLSLAEDELKEIAEAVHMKPGHRLKFMTLMRKRAT